MPPLVPWLVLLPASASLLPTPQWMALSGTLKGVARGWFVRRAERKGIPWRDSARSYRARAGTLRRRYDEVRDPNVSYPAYYTLPFHGYDAGNLNWRAAFEMEASAFSMTSAYWDDVGYGDAAAYVRGNFTACAARLAPSARRVLDVGCGTGISTAHLAAAFPRAEAVVGVDLSPYFLAVARDTCERGFPSTQFVHANAEELPFADGAFDLVCASYLLHELPEAAARRVIAECRRLLDPDGGVLAIVDLDPGRLQARLVSPFRRWAFEATEPHIYDYYSRADVGQMLLRAGFSRAGSRPNDPLNTIWVGVADGDGGAPASTRARERT